MITIDLSKKALKDLDGNELRDEGGEVALMGRLVARQYLQQTSSTDPVADMEYAQAFHKNGKVEMTSSEATRLEEMIKDAQTLTVLAKGQLLKEIRAQRVKAEDEAAKERAQEG